VLLPAMKSFPRRHWNKLLLLVVLSLGSLCGRAQLPVSVRTPLEWSFIADAHEIDQIIR
jgi:hypothetical protein